MPWFRDQAEIPRGQPIMIGFDRFVLYMTLIDPSYRLPVKWIVYR
jgi:hypothetical protein